MKKIALFALAALALMSCQREVVDPQESSVPTHTVTITARLAQTRTAYDDAGKFSWVAGDKINVLITNGTTRKQVAFTTTEAGPEVQFTGQVDEGFTVGAEAAYAIDFDAAKKAWVLPESVTVDPLTPLSSLPLFGAKDEGDLFQFKTATGVLKFTVENVPVETAAVSLETVGDEAPALCGKLEAAPADGVVTMAALKNGGKKLVAAGAPAEPNTTKDYYFFVPAGTLPAENTVFSVVDGSDNVIESFTFKKAVEVAANRITNVAPVHFEAVKIRNRQTDSLALVAVYNASKGAEWTKGNWVLTKEMSTWTGVTLTGGRVTALKLTTTVAIPEAWTLPDEVADLSALTELRINKQKLTGEFPKILCTMDWLKVLYLQGNNFTGALPAEIGQMTELTDLYVDQNASMSGSIPHEIGNLKNLMRLNISQSGIGGEIPVELGQCVELLQFMAFKSQLSGTIPDIWDLPKLQTFMVHSCPGLTGPLPASLGKLKKIASAGPSIQVQNCNITGNIPESFADLDGGEKKVQVQVQGNKMNGVVPASVQAHKDFSSWKIGPQQDGYELRLVDYDRRSDSLALVAIYNAIDASTWKEDKKWDLTKPINEWASGIKLNTDGRVTQISFTALLANALWTLPEEVGNLTELTTLKLNKNVKGQLPESVFTLPKLEKFYFENGDLEGTLSEKLAQMTSLTELYVDGNAKLQGSITAAFGQLKNLVKINVSNTGISGTLPAELANCTALTDIVAFNAKLSGELPDIWGSLTALKSLMLYGNQGLTGPLPASLGSLAKLTGIQIQNCSFTGNIPAEWGNLPSTCKTLNVSGNQLKGVVPSAVQAHANWTAWKPATNILPQQEGYGLTLE